MRRRKIAVLAAVTTVAAVAALCAISATAAPTRTAGAGTAPTVVTVRGDLEQAESVTGTLGFGPSAAIIGRRAGVITWLPRTGAEIHRGGTLWRVDDAPVVLLYGTLPLYRTLSAAKGSQTGPDVDLVAANLERLGFWHGTAHDAVYDFDLADAVEAWQRATHGTPTGTLHAGDAVVAPDAVRIDAVTAHLADSGNEPILSTTETGRTVVLAVPSGLAESLQPRERVAVTLPDGSTTTTAVSSIGQRSTSTNGTPPTVQVTVMPLDRRALDAAVLGPVTAQIVTAVRHSVVRVPVGALLALAGGGYALQRPDRSLLPVRVGIVADGMAEVDGVAPGVRVLDAS